jgi:glycosyltransferase involved in cell wall biosynthesis
MITIFTPSFADASNTNAQNLTVKEVVARLDPENFRVRMLYAVAPDARVAGRSNTELVRWRSHGNSARLLALLGWEPPDVYFFPREGPLDSGFLYLRRYLRLRSALVTYVVGTQENGPGSTVLARSIEEADAAVGNSLYCSQTIAERYGRTATTIHDGISREVFFAPAAGTRSDHSQLTVLYAGSFQARKRVHLVVQEAAKWPRVQFRLAGSGEEEEPCRSLAASLGCRNIEFLGHLPPRLLGEEMRKADVFLFPSVIEGHPQVLGQAAACGLPCIAMNGYRPDFVVDGETGFLVETKAELSERLGVLLTQEELRRSMSQAAVRHAAKFDWDDVTRKWEQLFEEAVARRRSSLGMEALKGPA